MAETKPSTTTTTPAKVLKLVKAKVAPRRSVFIDPMKTALPGDIVEFPADEIARMKGQGYVIDIEAPVAIEGVDLGASVKQTAPNAVTIERDRGPSASSTIR